MSTLDIDTSTGALKKLTIRHEQKLRNTFDGEIVALFNPNQLKYGNRVEWRSAGTVAQSVAAGFQRMEFLATPPATLQVDLFFDTYEGEQSSGISRLFDVVLPDQLRVGTQVSATDVSRLTTRVASLARVASELHRPPVCRLEWGRTVVFQGVLTGLDQDFTFFMPDGTPVRATLGCTFMAYRTFDAAAKDVELHSADVAKRRIVRRGDTPDRIAFAPPGDAPSWRDTARENAIDNPRAPAAGTVLVLPQLVS